MLTIKLKEKIDKCKIISFDIFDTVILRPFFAPSALFNYIEKKYNIQNFCLNRIKAEQLAYSNTKNGEDSSLDLIYSFYSELSKDNTGNNIPDIKQYEIDTEIEVCYPNKVMYEVYKCALDKGKKIIFVTDMYLPRQVIQKILHKNNYRKYEKLYISSEYSKLKRTGSLFGSVLKDLDVNANDILHIGDNYESDYVSPRKYGIETFYYQKCQDIYRNSNFFKIDYSNDATLSSYIFNCAINYHKYKDRNYWYKFGYEIAGPICMNYVKWIIQKVETADCNNVIFVARDGYLLEKVYNKLTNNSRNTYYLYAPRSLNLICHLDYEKDGGGGFYI